MSCARPSMSEGAAEPTLADILNELRSSREESAKLRDEFAAFRADTEVKLASFATSKGKQKEGEDDDSDDELLYVEHASVENPFPRRPRNCGLRPQTFDLYGDRTADVLEAKPNSSLRWEFRTLAPALSFFFDAKLVYESIREEAAQRLSEEAALALEGSLNTLDGIYEMLTARYATIKIRARAEAEPGGLSEENRVLLDYLDTQLHGIFPGEALVDSKVEGWLREFRDRKAAAELKLAANRGAASSSKGSRSESATTPKPTKLPKKKASKGAKAIERKD